MASRQRPLELLAPARGADIGHGADGVCIGGPAFGTRTHAGHTAADNARLGAQSYRSGLGRP